MILLIKTTILNISVFGVKRQRMDTLALSSVAHLIWQKSQSLVDLGQRLIRLIGPRSLPDPVKSRSHGGRGRGYGPAATLWCVTGRKWEKQTTRQRGNRRITSDLRHWGSLGRINQRLNPLGKQTLADEISDYQVSSVEALIYQAQRNGKLLRHPKTSRHSDKVISGDDVMYRYTPSSSPAKQSGHKCQQNYFCTKTEIIQYWVIHGTLGILWLNCQWNLLVLCSWILCRQEQSICD